MQTLTSALRGHPFVILTQLVIPVINRKLALIPLVHTNAVAIKGIQAMVHSAQTSMNVKVSPVMRRQLALILLVLLFALAMKGIQEMVHSA